MKQDKISFEEIQEKISIFLEFPDVERATQSTVQEMVENTMLSHIHNGNRAPENVLADYISEKTEDRLKIIVGLSGGSLEKLKRVYDAILPNHSWSELKSNQHIRKLISSFLINPHQPTFNIPQFIKDCFYLPTNWIELLKNKQFIGAVIQNTQKSKYAVDMGIALETMITNAIHEIGLEGEKGAVEIVDNKEVDVAIPNTTHPHFLIMSSYALTTSSAQSSRANEQSRMYQDIQTHNRRKINKNTPPVVFINVVEGGGWKNRKNDLQRMWTECDYCFTSQHLVNMQNILLS